MCDFSSTAGSRRAAEDAAEGHDREDLPVEVVVQVEVAGEARPGEVRLVPAAVVALGLDEEANGALDGLAGFAGGVQREQRPRGLGRGRGAAAPQLRLAVGA